jgi:hypothetical protein
MDNSRVISLEKLAIIYKTSKEELIEVFNNHNIQFHENQHYKKISEQLHFTVEGTRLIAKILNKNEVWESFEDIILPSIEKPAYYSTDQIAASTPDPEEKNHENL